MSAVAIPSKIYADRIPRTRVDSEGAVVSTVVLASEAVLESLVVVNSTGTAGFVQIHDAAALPDDTAVPLLSIPIAANGVVTLTDVPVYCATGIVAAISTTLATLTISANAALFYATIRTQTT